MTPVSLDALTPNETVPARSHTFAPAVVRQVFDYLTGANGNEPVRTLGIATFPKEGQARSALATLNDLLVGVHGAPHRYAATVRQTDDGQFKAILINKPARIVDQSNRKPRRKSAKS